MNTKQCLALLCAGALVAGCGGGGQGDEPAEAEREVPAAAMATPGAFIAFVAGMLKGREPEEGLSLGHLDAPADDAAEPVDLN